MEPHTTQSQSVSYDDGKQPDTKPSVLSTHESSPYPSSQTFTTATLGQAHMLCVGWSLIRRYNVGTLMWIFTATLLGLQDNTEKSPSILLAAASSFDNSGFWHFCRVLDQTLISDVECWWKHEGTQLPCKFLDIQHQCDTYTYWVQDINQQSAQRFSNILIALCVFVTATHVCNHRHIHPKQQLSARHLQLDCDQVWDVWIDPCSRKFALNDEFFTDFPVCMIQTSLPMHTRYQTRYNMKHSDGWCYLQFYDLDLSSVSCTRHILFYLSEHAGQEY